MERETQKHVVEERLEAYAMSLMEGDELVSTEEHLLFCASCQDQLEAVERYVQVMQSASHRIRTEESQAPAVVGILDRLRTLLHYPLPIWGGAVAMAVIILVVGLQVRPKPGAPVDVELQAVRGATFGTAQAGHALRLRLDNHGLAEMAAWRIEIVDSRGSRVWKGTGTWSDLGVKATVPQAFTPGTYFVRLLKDSPDPVREYQLVIQ